MKRIFPFALLAAFLLLTSWAFASESISSDLSSGIVRLHILANSDADFDQELKYKVRDRLLLESRQTPKLLTDPEIQTICEDEVQKNGYHYPVNIPRGRFSFPRKQYKNLSLPAGTYNAVRVEIGDGLGQNWWCVMYPPLCFAGESGGVLDDEMLTSLRQSISPEAYAMICESDTITVKPSFKLVELWNSVKTRLTP